MEEKDMEHATETQETVAAEQTENNTESTANETTETVIDPLEAAQQALNEQKDKYLRLFAEFDNFKKRNAKERLELFKTAGQDVIRDMLPVLDDFQRASKAYESSKDVEAYLKGIELIKEKFFKTLQGKGLKTIESIGATFDVEKHEAIAEIPAATEDMKGKVVDEVESGYTLNEVIIRYAKVVVGK